MFINIIRTHFNTAIRVITEPSEYVILCANRGVFTAHELNWTGIHELQTKWTLPLCSELVEHTAVLFSLGQSSRDADARDQWTLRDGRVERN